MRDVPITHKCTMCGRPEGEVILNISGSEYICDDCNKGKISELTARNDIADMVG